MSEIEARTRLRLPLLSIVFAVALVGVYVWQGMTVGHYVEFSAEELMMLGANVPAYSLSDQSYRLLTNVFLHGSITHLLFNVVALLLIGAALEAVIRHWQWLLIFVGGGLFASLMTAVLNLDRQVEGSNAFGGLLGMMQPVWQIHVSVGASGAIMALSGASAVLALYVRRFEPQDTATWRSLQGALLFSAINLVTGLFISNIDAWAHAGGALFGVLAGIALLALRLRRAALRVAVAALAIGACAVAAVWQWQWAQAHPQGPAIRAATDELAASLQQRELEQQAAQAREEALRDEARDQPAPVDAQAAAGHIIDVPGVIDIVPSGQDGRVFLAANGKQGARVLEYDLDASKVLRTVVQVPYAQGEDWFCPFPNCQGVGIVGLEIDAAAGKGYAVGLVKGAFSRIDLASGQIDYSVPIPSAEQARNQFLVHEGRAWVATNPGMVEGGFAMYRPDMLLTEIDVTAGTVLRQLPAPPMVNRLHDMMSMTMDLVWSAATQSLYLLDPGGRLTRFDPAAGRFDAPIEQTILSIGVDGQGQVWALDWDGVRYPGTARAARSDVLYKQRSSRPEHRSKIFNPVLGSSDPRTPMIVQGGGSQRLLAISVLTGKVVRAYPVHETEQVGFRLKTVGPSQVHVVGVEQAQLIDLDQAMAPGEHGAGFEKELTR